MSEYKSIIDNGGSKVQLPRTEDGVSVAVCLAAYNGRAWIREQLDSILHQENVSVTVFVSVDLSNDGTEAWVEEYSKSDNRVVQLPTGLRLGGAAANFFRLIRDVDFAEFDYVSFADQDDVWHSDKLWRAHCVLVQQGADGYSCNVTAFWPDGRTKLINKAQPQRHWDYIFEAAGPGCTYVMRRDLALAIQEFVRNHWAGVQAVVLHDWLTYAYARANGYIWVIDDWVGMQYRQHSANQVGVNVGLKAFVFRAKKVLCGWFTTQAALIANLVDLDGDPFVMHWKKGGSVGLVWLALHASQCRRRGRDRIFFALSCLILAATGRNHRS